MNVPSYCEPSARPYWSASSCLCRNHLRIWFSDGRRLPCSSGRQPVRCSALFGKGDGYFRATRITALFFSQFEKSGSSISPAAISKTALIISASFDLSSNPLIFRKSFYKLMESVPIFRHATTGCLHLLCKFRIVRRYRVTRCRFR